MDALSSWTVLRRLADEGIRAGIRIYREHGTGACLATSRTDLTRVYRVTAYSCTCPGFVRYQRCTHHAVLYAVMGWLPTDPDPRDEAQSTTSEVTAQAA